MTANNFIVLRNVSKSILITISNSSRTMYMYVCMYFFFNVVYCLLHYFVTIEILQAFYLFTIVVTSNITVSFTQRLAPQVVLN